MVAEPSLMEEVLMIFGYKLSQVRKAGGGALAAMLPVLFAALQAESDGRGGVTLFEASLILGAGIAAAGVVFRVPNAPGKGDAPAVPPV